MRYYVSAAATSGNGSQEAPFPTIQEAANLARPGDEVFVLPGVYRESVNPLRGGTEEARITYRASQKGAAVITGAEPLSGWEPLGGGVWKASVPNAIFTDRNPYTTLVSGDWFIASFVVRQVHPPTTPHSGCASSHATCFSRRSGRQTSSWSNTAKYSPFAMSIRRLRDSAMPRLRSFRTYTIRGSS